MLNLLSKQQVKMPPPPQKKRSFYYSNPWAAHISYDYVTEGYIK